MTAETVLTLLCHYGARAETVDGRVKIIGASRLPPEVLEGARSVKHNLAKLLAVSKEGDTGGIFIDSGGTPPASSSNNTMVSRPQASTSYGQDRADGSVPRTSELRRGVDCRRRESFSGRDSACAPVNESLGSNYNSIRSNPRSVKPKRIPRPDETPRLDWWRQPVYGWQEGKLWLTSAITGETVEIDLKA
jgi:hypothetical protein